MPYRVLFNLSFAITIAAAAEPAPLFDSIRAGDAAYLQAHVTAENVNSRDRRGATLLMHAAAFGNLETLKLLLDKGADVNAHNDFDATALLWAARYPEKAQLLVAHGAEVNVRSKQGRTPLMLASLLRGGAPTVELMLSKGANVNVKDNRGDTALGLASTIGEIPTMRLLLAKGADVQARNQKGETTIILATKSKEPRAVRMLIEAGVDVNLANTSNNIVRNGPIGMVKLTPLHRAAAFGPPEMVTALLAAKAEVNARDIRGLTPLTFAVSTESPSMDIVDSLLKAGADVNLRDTNGESALDWAVKFGHPRVIAALKKAGAKPGTLSEGPKPSSADRIDAATAITRSIDLLQKSSALFFNRSGCVGCHHQPLVARAIHASKAAGIRGDAAAEREMVAQIRAPWLTAQEEFLQSINPGGGANRVSEELVGMAAAGYPADTMTDSAIVDLAEAQAADGRWAAGEEQPRPPITESEIGSTARAIGALQAYAIPARRQEFAARVARARAWLKQASAVTTEEHAMRLLGLGWGGATPAELREAAKPLLALQRQDGGWAGNPYLASDAFSTGIALTALSESGVADLPGEAYRSGVNYLLSTQHPDGSWYVRSRSIKFQPYFEGGFPFGHDQWISTAATGWAVQAIAATIRPAAGND